MRFLLVAVVLVGCTGAHLDLSPDGAVAMGSAACTRDDECATGQSCCDHACIDTTSNTAACGGCRYACAAGDGCCDGSCKPLSTQTDCGACGNACGADSTCDGTQCAAPSYPQFCANNTVYEIYDGITNDNRANDMLAQAVRSTCAPSVTVTTGNQTDAALVNQSTGQPIAGSGVTYLLSGGPFASSPVAWTERTAQLTAIYFDAPDGVNYYWRQRSNGTAVASMLASQCTTHRDQFITELVPDTTNNTLSLIGYGACTGNGTIAAAFYYANVIVPNLAGYPDRWYVVSWQDSNNDNVPNLGDTFTVLAHGG